jgi:preprotein translocase subunit SecA
LIEYKIAGADLFDEMVLNIRDDTVRGILSAMPEKELQRVQIAKPSEEGFMSFGAGQKRVVRTAAPKKNPPKVGRNDPCPCGSGKKYKKCCGANVQGE